MWINCALQQKPIIEPVFRHRTHVASEMSFALSTNESRPDRPRGSMGVVLALLALLLVLLRPACDAFAASGAWQAPAPLGHGAAQMANTSAGGHFDDGICCASADVQALTVRATAPLHPSSSGTLAAPSTAIHSKLIPLALPVNILARRDPAPPLPFHARSLRRRD